MQHNKYLVSIINSTDKADGDKSFWNYIKSHKQYHVGISTFQTSIGIAMTTVSKEDVLNNIFKSVFTKEYLSVLPLLPDSSIQEIDISEPGVFSLLSQLNHHKAGGPDCCILLCNYVVIMHTPTHNCTHAQPVD